MDQLKKPIFLLFCLTFFLSAQVDYNSEIQEPIFNESCALAGCHVAGHITGLDLSPGNSYGLLVNVVSTNYPPNERVIPFDANGSVLYNKVANTGTYGGQMPPPPNPALSQGNIQLIMDWINEGALEFPASPGSSEVVISVLDTAYDAYTNDIVVILSLFNTDTVVGGVQLDIEDFPDLLSATDVIAVGRAEGFNVSFTNLEDGILRVVLVNTLGGNISKGDGPILEIHYDGSDIPSAIIDLNLSGIIISDPDGVEIEAMGENGTLKIGPTASLFVTGGTADAAESVDIFISLTNDAGVGGLQFDLFDDPNLVDIDSVWTLRRAEAFEANWNIIGGGIRVLIWDVENGIISPGEGDVVGIRAIIDPFAHAGDISLNLSEVSVSDSIGGSIWIDTLGTGFITVYPGFLEPPQNLVATGGLDGVVPLAWEAPVGGGGPIGNILLIDDDNSLNNGGPYEGDVAGDMATALTAGGYAFDEFVVSSAADGPDEETMSGYDLVIWMTGYEWGYGPTLTPIDRSNLTTYANNGGNLWVIGEDIPFDIGATDPFLTEVMGIESIIEETGNPNPYVGESGTFMEGASYEEADIGFPDGPWGDDLTPGNSAFGILNSAGTNFGAIANSPGGYRSVYWGMEFAFITDSGDELDCVNRTLSWFSAGKIEELVGIQQVLSSTGHWVRNFEISDRKGDAISVGIVPFDFTFNFIKEETVSYDVRTLEGFNIYRSETEAGPYDLIDTTDPEILNYDDNTVTNGIWYYYVVSADYGVMGESEYSNESAALPAEWVNMSLSDGSAISGYTDTVWVSLANTSPVGDFSFIVVDVPDNIIAQDIVNTDRTTGYDYSLSELPGGTAQVVFTQSGDPVSAGDGPVCGIVYLASSTEQVNVTMSLSDLDVLSPTGSIFMVGTEPGQFQIFVEAQYCFLSAGYAEPGEQGSVELSLTNTQPIYGFEIFLADNPHVFTSEVSVEATERVPASISLSISESNGVYWLTAVGFSADAILPGSGPIATIIFRVATDAEPGTITDMEFVSYQFWDQANNEILTLISLDQFAVGTPEALFLIEEGAGNAGGSGYYEVELENSLDVFGFQLFIEDFPDWLTVVDVEKTGRIPADASLSWNEFTDGTLRILEFDMDIPIEAIVPGSGPILVVSVEVIPSALEGEIELKFTQATASDEAGDPTIFSFGMGGLFEIGTTGISDESRKIIPEYFALHQNYPNPFNPVTTIAYDLPDAGDITVTILNILGQEVTTLVNGYRQPGIYQVIWDGRDNIGQAVNSGLYFYQIKSKKVMATKKMILLK